MNPTHIHLLLNHFPIVGTLIGSAILLYSIIKKQNTGKTIGTFIIVVMAVIALPVFLTGEPAEESIEDMAGISKALIHDHEEASEKAFWLMEVTGIISLVALIFYKTRSAFAPKSFLIAFAFSAISFFAMAWTGYLGGKIRHPETSNTFVADKPATNSQTENDE
jgi:FtsH-binding integral membrane protein